jgi:hypothetical protein
MKRLAVLLLVVLLPFQISWAVAGRYCTHEQSSATQHFGHHAHVHHAQPGDNDSRSPLQQHQDCSACHAVMFSVLQDNVLLDDVLPSLALSPQFIFFLPSGVPSEPERPKWRLAV